MFNFFKKKRKNEEEEFVSVWKGDFSDCVTADYLPSYSVCQNEKNNSCRYVAHYAGMILCCHPKHKTFIPEGAERFNPRKKQFRD